MKTKMKKQWPIFLVLILILFVLLFCSFNGSNAKFTDEEVVGGFTITTG